MIRKLLIVSVLAMTVTGASSQDSPARDELKYPEPILDESWQLVHMKHNCSNHNVYVYKDKLYDALFTRTLGWNGGDGVQTTLLPGGHLFWSFNDSFYGTVQKSLRSRISSKNNFPRNTIMVQKAGADAMPSSEQESLIWLADFVQTTNSSRDDYYKARTHIRHPKGEKSDAQIAAGDIDQQYLYWAGDGTVVNGQLQVLWAGVYNGTENLMQADNRALAIYSLEGEPGDESYLKLISVDHNFFEYDPIGYGSTLWEDEDGHTYLYAGNQYFKTPDDIIKTCGTVVARSTTHDLRSQWEYYIADENGNFSWQTTYPTEAEVNRSSICETSLSTAWVFKKGDYYYLTGQSFPYGKQLYIARSKSPYGPFVNPHQLMTMPNVLDKVSTRTYQHFYMPHLHMGLSREGELVFSSNTDCAEFGDNFDKRGSADFYRPYFFRIYNWESLFEEDGI